MSNPTPLSRTKYAGTPSCSCQPGLDPGLRALTCELDGISQQVDVHLLEHGGISLAGRQVAYDHFDLSPILFGAQCFQRRMRHIRCAHALLPQRLLAEPREGQQVVHQLAHGLCVGAHQVQVSAGLRRQTSRVVVNQDA